jgi:hypothetical protein
MWCLAIAASLLAAQTLDVSALTLKTETIVELDLGQLKGDLRQIGWSPDASQLYIQTVDGQPPNEKIRHFIVGSEGGRLMPTDRQPEWAEEYWRFKSDRSAPGMASLQIDVVQKLENVRLGTGSGRPDDAGSGSGDSVTKSAERQHQSVVQLTLVGEVVSEFVNERPIPGLMFSWGPEGSGAIAYTTREDGRLMLLDAQRHKQAVAGVKDATLPAWSTDGTRLAWAQKTGRRKYNLVWAGVTK